MNELSVALVLVEHDFYRDFGLKKIAEKCRKPHIVMDVPNMFVDDRQLVKGLVYWSL